ncbi:hypothetical protein EW093_00080 [Thiospirochaeta perfilievii]|uniref:Uncharacterized protein n=1 Tax=Thiospirochaeta perfilievii TaxID=252967 RepID=A0A5C1Q520_9SPIO|nr:hypothetical protein [Thiospirochaeta perfilievii]QEN03163.1 hypothetical protein EW093_00080 [Thiospirochaeta perfilievii]
MKREETIKLATYIINAINNKKMIPSNLFKSISSIISNDPGPTYKIFLEIWKNSNKGDNRSIDYPLLLSRGFNNDITTEEQLSTYLPEEKILINKDIFRNNLKGIDLLNIDNLEQKRLIDVLNRESIGLSNNDVLLYYNLLKINQITKSESSTTTNSERDYATELLKLTTKNFNLIPTNVKKINGGKEIDESEIIKYLNDSINKKKLNPQVLAICLGYKNSKFINFFIDFLTFVSKQRGEDPQDVFCYAGLYILLNGANQSQLSNLNIISNVEAFINDRIGRVRSIYYVTILFVHTYNLVLAAQVYEISNKFNSISLDQRLKLEKLYSSDTRRKMLVTNAFNIASRKISAYKNESIEVLNTYKKFKGVKLDIITAKDLFEYNYSK